MSENEPINDGQEMSTRGAILSKKALDENIDWNDLTIEEVMKEVVQPHPKVGVYRSNVEHRRETFGSNIIPTKGGPSLLYIIFSNFCNSITAILAFVAVVSGVFEDWAALGICIFVILFVGIIGVKQEWGAAQSLESLKSMTKGTATVIRDGTADVIATDDVVIGDVLVLEQGTTVAADCRIIECTGLEIDECLLTGESLPVVKRTSRIEGNVPLGDRKNCGYRNTNVTSGRGKGIVFAVGLQTEMGKVAAMLMGGGKKKTEDGKEAEPEPEDDGQTELQKKMNRLMLVIFAFCLVLVVVVFAANSFNMEASVILYGAAVAIAILPQSLVAVIAVAMAISVRKMASQKCIVRKLGSLEVLDRVTDICSDKTGTLTQNKMTVARMLVGMDDKVIVAGSPLQIEATFRPAEGEKRKLMDIEDLQENSPLYFEFMRSAALCSTTVLQCNDGLNLDGTGNPTEIALQALAWKAGSPREKFEKEGYESKGEFPFDSSIKRMSASYFTGKDSYITTKGAPERVLKLCKWKMGKDGKLADLSEDDVTHINGVIESFARLGLRTICLTKRNVEAAPVDVSGEKKMNDYLREEVESELVYLGVVGIYDPPRVESKLSVRICRRAGITVRMLTGDHFATAAAIATEISILQDDERDDPQKVMVGPVFDELSAAEMAERNELPLVVGRCSPQTKVRMIDELHRRGRVAAMTGDGFNDSPSIKAADIGCAMGSGTDVTKGVADFIITDDNFATIVKALAEGRRISLAISKFVTHLLCGNFAETIVLICGLGIMQDETSVFILSPMEILWLNLFTSTPPAIGLSLDPPPDDVLRTPPNTKGIFNKELAIDTLIYGGFMGAISLCSFIYVLYGPNDGVEGKDCNRTSGEGCEAIWTARATAFTVLYFSMLIHAYNVRFSRRSLFTMPILDNAWLWGSFVFGIATIMVMLYVEEVATEVFIHGRLTWHWGVVGVGLVIFITISEIYKLIKNAVDPKPVYEITEEEEAMEQALFQNQIVAEDAQEARDARDTNSIVTDELKASFARQASFSTAL